VAVVLTEELPEEVVEGVLDDRVDVLARREDETVMGKPLEDDGLLDKGVGWAGAGCRTGSFDQKNYKKRIGWVVSSDQEMQQDG